MGAGRNRAGECLRVNVALIGQGQAVGGQQRGDVAQPRAGAEPGAPGVRVCADESGQSVELEELIVAGGDRGEGVPGSAYAHPLALFGSGGDDVLDLGIGAGGVEGLRVGPDAAGPVAQCACHVSCLFIGKGCAAGETSRFRSSSPAPGRSPRSR